MTATLSTALLDENRKPAAVTDLVGVVEAEVSEKKGIGGVTIKTAFGAVKKVSPSVIESAISRLLPDFATALDPFWADFVASGDNDFGLFLSARGNAASDALLAVTDRKAESANQAVLKKAYGSLRGKAAGNVIAALPRLGSTLAKHAG